MGDVKALTLLQPWATLVAIRAKKIETRSWSTPYRGPLLIHASKKLPQDAYWAFVKSPFSEALTRAGIRQAEQYHPGCIIALVELDWCRVITGDNAPPEPEFSFGNYEPGRYAWHLANVRAFPEPIPARGSQRLWTPDPETMERIRGQQLVPVDVDGIPMNQVNHRLVSAIMPKPYGPLRGG